MSIRSGVYWAIAGAIVMAGCASLVGAEEATLVQGTGGTAGQGGTGQGGTGQGGTGQGGTGQGGTAGQNQGGAAGGGGQGECNAPKVDCSGICSDLQLDSANCGKCGRSCGTGPCEQGFCGPEVLPTPVGAGWIADLKATDAYLYALYDNGTGIRWNLDTLEVVQAFGPMAGNVKNLASFRNRLFALYDTDGAGNWKLYGYEDFGSPLANTLNNTLVSGASRITAAGMEGVFVNQGSFVYRFPLNDSLQDVNSLGLEPEAWVADDKFLYAVGQSKSMYLPLNGAQAEPAGACSMCVHVALWRSGGAVYVDRGAAPNTGFAGFFVPGTNGPYINNLNYPTEAAGADNGVYFIEDAQGEGRISFWNESQPQEPTTTLAKGQKDARALVVTKTHVYWAASDQHPRRMPR